MIRILTTLAPWAIIGAFVIPPWMASLESSDNWFKVSSITIPDADRGSPIYMTVNRVIARPFVGAWVATIRRITEEGTEVSCVSYGTSSYRKDAVLPKPTLLDWWTYPIKCDLDKGRYRLDTVWQFDVAAGVTKTVTAESNVFQVR